MTSRPTNWVNCCLRCRAEFSWVELYRYKHPLTHERVYGCRPNMTDMGRDDPLEVVKFWCWSESGRGSTISFFTSLNITRHGLIRYIFTRHRAPPHFSAPWRSFVLSETSSYHYYYEIIYPNTSFSLSTFLSFPSGVANISYISNILAYIMEIKETTVILSVYKRYQWSN